MATIEEKNIMDGSAKNASSVIGKISKKESISGSVKTSSEVFGKVNAKLGLGGNAKNTSSLTGSINQVVKTLEPEGSLRIYTNGAYDVKGYALVNVAVGGRTQEKSVIPSKTIQNVVPDDGYSGLSKVTVNPIGSEYIIPTGSLTVTRNGNIDVTQYKNATINVQSGEITLQDKTAIPSKYEQTVQYDVGYDGLNSVKISPIPDEYVIPYGSVSITQNGNVDVSNYANAMVNVQSGTPLLQSKTVTPRETSQNVSYDTGYDGLSSVVVNAIPSTYIIPSGEYTIETNGKYNIKNYESVDVNVPTPTFKTQEKSVSPSRNSQVVQPDASYNGLSKVTVSPIPNEYIIPSGTQNITSNGEYDIKSYEKVNVNVEGGGGGGGDTTALIWGGKNPVLVDTKTLTINIANDTTFSSITPSTTNQQILATSLSQYTQVSPSLDIKNYDYVVVFDVICKPTYTTAPTVSYTDTESKKVIYQISRRASNTYLTRVVNTINVSGEYNSSIWWRNGITKYYSGMVLYGITLNHTTPTLSNANADVITINYLNPKLGVQNNTYGQEPGAWDTFDASSTNVYMRWQTYRVDKDSVAGEAYEQVKSMNDSLTFPDNTVTIQNMLDVSYDSTTGVLTINDSVR